MDQTIKILIVEPGKEPRPATVTDNLEMLQKIVGGPIEAGCYLPQRVMLICNGEGELMGLPPNRPNPSDSEDFICGTFLLCSFEGEHFASLTPAQQTRFQTHFALSNLKAASFAETVGRQDRDFIAEGRVDLVDDIQTVMVGGKEMHFYSFASKYCSHHNEKDYPIYDGYVDEVLRYFRARDGFARFQNAELKIYSRFKELLLAFRAFYGLERFSLKEVDKYIWQLGKEYFPKTYA